MKASELLVKCLENEGVEYIFGVPGEENIDVLDSLSRSKIKFVVTRHEQGATFIANVYARLCGKPGVCLATLGPGATNLMTGIADANLDRVPLVTISGQAKVALMHKESHQYIDIPQAFTPITKWSVQANHADMIPEVVRKAFRIALAEKTGAVHIELPEDVAEDQTNMQVLTVASMPQGTPAQHDLLKAADFINKSASPLILAGNGVLRTNASRELIAFAEKTNIPVATTFMGKGSIPSDHELSLSTIGLQAKDYVMCGFERADCIITIGYDLVEYAPSFWNPAGEKKIIHVDTQGAEVDSNYVPQAEVIGDIKAALRELSKKVKKHETNEYAKRLKKIIRQERESTADDKSFPLIPQKIVYDMRTALAASDVLISDVGAHKMWIARMYPALEPNTCLISNGFAAMGIALPGAIGAKLACPDKKVIAACGDGAFLMTCYELETAKRLGVAFVVVIFNDSKYGLIEWKQLNKFKKSFGVEFTNPDFVKLAEAFGARGTRIQKASELLPTLKKALTSNELWVIDVPVDSNENLKLTEKLGKNVCIM